LIIPALIYIIRKSKKVPAKDITSQKFQSRRSGANISFPSKKHSRRKKSHLLKQMAQIVLVWFGSLYSASKTAEAATPGSFAASSVSVQGLL
jgi:hypothetical protein